MPHKKKITIPGSIVHIMAKGISGIDIFLDEDDRRVFLEFLSAGILQNGYQCYGWALLTNHYHLLLRCSENPLDGLMRRLNSKYARYCNRKRERHGYLFQDRYKSILSQDQRYLEELVRYIHLNPFRAGICKTIDDLDRYPWCGHAVLLGHTTNAFQTTDAVLRRFGSTVEEARKRYREYLLKGIDSIDDDWLVSTVRKCNDGLEERNNPHCWVIGDREFVISVMKKHEQRLRIAKSAREQWSLDAVAQKIADDHGISIEALKKGNRSTISSIAKKKFAFLCCRVFRFPVARVADYLGLSSPAVSWAINKGSELLGNNDINKFTNLPPGRDAR